MDDSSTDNSYEIIQKFAETDRRFKVYRKKNQKFACYGIKYGVDCASGEWFCYMSQDDRLSPDYLEKTLAAATATGADIALGKLVCFYDDIENKHEMPVGEGEVMDGIKAFELSLNWRIHGFYILKMSLMRKIGISTGLLNDDEYDTRLYFFFANKVTVSGGTFFYHQGNPDAITKKWNISQLDFVKVAHKLRLFAHDNDIEHIGDIDNLLKIVSADACIRAAKMVFASYRANQSSKHEINQVMYAICSCREDWSGSSSALKIGVAIRPLVGNYLALAFIINALKLRSKIRNF